MNIGKKGKLGENNLGSWKITMENIFKVCDYFEEKRHNWRKEFELSLRLNLWYNMWTVLADNVYKF